MPITDFAPLISELAEITSVHAVGRVAATGRGQIDVRGLDARAAVGAVVEIATETGLLGGEVVSLEGPVVRVLTDGAVDGVRLGDRVRLLPPARLAPDDSWIGRVLDPFGRPLDGKPIFPGPKRRAVQGKPPPAVERRLLGKRLETGMAVFNTLLPVVRGQRIGLFAGSGVGKSTLLGNLAVHLDADVVVIALIGERGREVPDFVSRVLGPAGMARSVVIAATSDQSPLTRRRAAWSAMAVAEHFRDQGKHVLFLADSVTRYAEAHREIALATGEPATLRGYPPSTTHLITGLCERAGPGAGEMGDITAVFSVLVAGSDMEEPIADILRGVLDGHVVLDRAIAERGRYPAVDLLRSISRSLPHAASIAENEVLAEVRRILGAYDQAELMIRAGLYETGTDPVIDYAIEVYPALDAYLAEIETENTAASFARLAEILKEDKADRKAAPRVSDPLEGAMSSGEVSETGEENGLGGGPASGGLQEGKGVAGGT